MLQFFWYFLMFHLGVITYAWSGWFIYVVVMGVYRAYLDDRLTPMSKMLGWPAIIIGMGMDVIANFTIATILFLELPKEILVTTRLQRHIKYSQDWRQDFSRSICNNLLDVFDPRGSHCVKEDRLPKQQSRYWVVIHDNREDKKRTVIFTLRDIENWLVAQGSAKWEERPLAGYNVNVYIIDDSLYSMMLLKWA